MKITQDSSCDKKVEKAFERAQDKVLANAVLMCGKSLVISSSTEATRTNIAKNAFPIRPLWIEEVNHFRHGRKCGVHRHSVHQARLGQCRKAA